MGFYRENRGGHKPVAGETALRLDVRWMKRRGYLRPLWQGSVEWTHAGRNVACIGYRTDQGADGRPSWLDLSYAVGGESVRESVSIEWMPQHLGGVRPWFRCPCCSKRVAVLWGLGRFLCRACNRVAYPVQNEGKSERLERRAMNLRTRLGIRHGTDFSVADAAGLKPKWMRRPTYRRLFGRALEAERRWHAAEVARWGAWAHDFLPIERQGWQ